MRLFLKELPQTRHLPETPSAAVSQKQSRSPYSRQTTALGTAAHHLAQGQSKGFQECRHSRDVSDPKPL